MIRIVVVAGGVLHGAVPLRDPDDPADPSGDVAGFHGRHLVLRDAALGRAEQSQCLGRRRHADLLLALSLLGRSHHAGQLQPVPQQLLQVHHFTPNKEPVHPFNPLQFGRYFLRPNSGT